MTADRFRCTNTDCAQAEQFLHPDEVVAISQFGGALYHAYDRQGSLLDPAEHAPNVTRLPGTDAPPFPLPCGPVERIEGPCRIRLRRRKGWRKPPGAIVCTRPGRFGNPLTMDGDREAAAEWFGVMLDLRARGALPAHHVGYLYPSDDEIRALLRGSDLACWCPLETSCHADSLLEIANRPVR